MNSRALSWKTENLSFFMLVQQIAGEPIISTFGGLSIDIYPYKSTWRWHHRTSCIWTPSTHLSAWRKTQESKKEERPRIGIELALNNQFWASNSIQWQIINITKGTHFQPISFLQYKELFWLSQKFDPLMTAERASGQKIITVCQTVWHSTLHMVQQTVSKIWPQGGLKHIVRKYSYKWSTEHPTADQCLKWAILSSWNVFD